MRLDLIQRVKLVFSMNDLKDAVKELDDAASALDRFTRILLWNRRMVEGKSSKNAVKLAKGLRHVRKFARSLSLAIFQAWRTGCHSKHEARLFLEDRVNTVPEILKQIGKVSAVPILSFQLIFAADINQEQKLWHETVVQVFNDDSTDHSKPSILSQNSGSSSVTLATTKSASSLVKAEITSVGDICGTIEEAKCSKREIVFALVGNQQMGTILTEKKTLIQCQQAGKTTLKALLLSANSRRHGPIIPWKFRMVLALRLASNLLQLLQTQWLQSTWSKDMVYFQLQPTNSGAQNPLRVDFGRLPFVSLTFDDRTRSTQPERSVEPKMALLELGILLLEVWHEITLETRFSLEDAPSGYYQRLALAVEWLDDTDNPLPDLYDRAVSYCIQQLVSEAHFPDWEDTKLWATVCAEVIEPLSEICRQWR